MRPSILISILLLPLSTFAAPHQRRGAPLAESGAGASEAALADTAAHSPVVAPAAPKAIASEPGSPSIKAETEKSTLPGGSPSIKAETEEPTLPDGSPSKPLPTEPNAFVKWFQDSWKWASTAPRQTLQGWFDALAEKTEKDWEKENERIQQQAVKFRTDQERELSELQKSQQKKERKFTKEQDDARKKNDWIRRTRRQSLRDMSRHFGVPSPSS